MLKTAELPEHRTALSDAAHRSNCGTLITVVVGRPSTRCGTAYNLAANLTQLQG